MSDKTLVSIIKILCFLIPFSLLIIARPFLFPYITGKALYFRILVELAVFFTALLLLKRKDLLPTLRLRSGQAKKDYIFWASLILLASLFLLIPFSVRPYLSFWGNAERMEGVWGMLHFFLWFFVLYFLFKAEPESKKIIFWSFAFVSVLINAQEIQEGIFEKSGRPYATLGNATYIGFFNLLVLFLSAYFIGIYKKDKISRFIIYILMALSVFGILISQTRGAILGLAGGILALILYFIFASVKKPTIKILYFAILVLVVFASFAFLKTDFALKIPGIGRVAQSIEQGKSMYMPRLISWGIFWDAFKSRPIFGFGLENSPDAYYRHFNSDMFIYEEVIFDRPHNKYLEILVTQGIVGFLVWLVFMLITLYSLIFVKDKYFKGVLFGFLIAYLVQNFTLFDMQASYLAFFFGLALLAVDSQKIRNDEISKSNTKTPQLIKIETTHSLVSAIFVVLLIIGLYFNFQHLYVVRNIIKVFSFNPNIAIDKYLALSDKAGNFLPEQAIILNSYVNGNISKINQLDQLDKITLIFKKAYKKDPLDLRVANAYSSFLVTVIKGKIHMGMDYNAEKEEVSKIFETLMRNYPTFPDVYINYAIFLSIVNEKQKSLDVLKNNRNLFLKSKRLTVILVGLFENIGENKTALEFIESAKKEGWISQDIETHFLYLRLLLKNKKTYEAKTEIGEIFKANSSADIINRVNQTIKEFGYKGF